jgi:hypothetical protein
MDAGREAEGFPGVVAAFPSAAESFSCRYQAREIHERRHSVDVEAGAVWCTSLGDAGVASGSQWSADNWKVEEPAAGLQSGYDFSVCCGLDRDERGQPT